MQFQSDGGDCSYDGFDDGDCVADHYTLSVPMSQVPSGAVCLFEGDYTLDTDALSVLKVIPTEHCIIPATEGAYLSI